ncbi:arylsulfatase [Cupriavidus sp. NPDC089707]|uniref:arylsulfatase n=1 Tax=Cupriavidus sp. NPDC089707 TaxID=3363963 RepID=UPI0037F11467
MAFVLATGTPNGASAADEALRGVAQRPNILLIVADDLGYSDIGAFGGEIHTPTLDALARQGLRMTQFYVAPTCSPTRAMLMSGVDSHRAGLGAMAETMVPEQRGKPGYEGYLNENVVAFPELLRDAGYHTYMTGKWHLGQSEAQSPAARGFEQSYVLTQGAANHFGQRGIASADPKTVPKAMYRENGKLVDVPADFYSSNFFAQKMLSYIDSNRDGKPFFGYLAFTAPHWPLQAPDAYIRKYEGKYDVGYDVIRAQRLERMKALGIVPRDMDSYAGNARWPKWSELTPAQRQSESRRVAVYAAMVEAMDAEIGRVVEHLKQTGQYDNTLIFFMSDNGADGNSILDEPAGLGWVRDHTDNSLANLGRADSFVEYGPGWGQVSMTPMKLYKAFANEGGIASPAIAVAPRRVRASQLSQAPAHVTDVAPTILELAGVQRPAGGYKGRSVLAMTGTSMLAFLSGQQDAVHAGEFLAGWELNGRKALRKGDWKIVSANPPWGNGAWQLYNLRNDRAEQRDVARQHPAKLKELIADYEVYQRDNGVQDVPGLAGRKGYSNGDSYYADEGISARR